MVALLKFFVLFLIFVLFFSAVFGLIAFFMDLHSFKSEKDLSLPRKRLIEALFEEQDLKKQSAEQSQNTSQCDNQEP